MQAEHDFRKAKARALDRDAHLAGQRHFQPAAEAKAVDHGNRRHAQGFEAVDHRVRAADRFLDRFGIGGAAEFVDIGAGDEAGSFRGTNDKTGRPLLFQLGEDPVQFSDDI